MPRYKVNLRLESWRGDRVASVPDMSDQLSLTDRDTYLELAVGPVEQPDGNHALALARILGERMARLLALSFSAFRVTGLRIAGPAGWDSIGDVRWQSVRTKVHAESDGHIMSIDLEAHAVRGVLAELNLWDAYDSWSPRVTAALDLFWEAQCTDVRDVRHVLLMAALDALIAPRANENLLAIALDKQRKNDLIARLGVLCTEFGLDPAEAVRLQQSALGTKRQSAQDVALAYFTDRAPSGLSGFRGPATADSIRGWFKARHKYVHAGDRVPAEVDVDHLNEVMGVTIRSECGL